MLGEDIMKPNCSVTGVKVTNWRSFKYMIRIHMNESTEDINFKFETIVYIRIS